MIASFASNNSSNTGLIRSGIPIFSALFFKARYALLEPTSILGEKRLQRVPRVSERGIVWRDEWLPWHMEKSLIEPYTYPDEVRLQQLRKSLAKSKEIWESDFDYAPVPIGNRGERAFYPRLCLWVRRLVLCVFQQCNQLLHVKHHTVFLIVLVIKLLIFAKPLRNLDRLLQRYCEKSDLRSIQALWNKPRFITAE